MRRRKRLKQIEPHYTSSIFIEFVNTPLRNNPEGLYATLRQIKIYLTPLHREIEKKVDHLVKLSNQPYDKRFKKIHKDARMAFGKRMEMKEQLIEEMQREEKFYAITDRIIEEITDEIPESVDFCLPRPVDELMEEAHKDPETIMDVMKGVYGSQLMGCDYHPEKNPFGCRWGDVRRRIFETEELKCYECDHEHFVYILKGLTEGKEYSEIIGMKLLLESSRLSPPAVRIFQDNNSQFKETIELNSHNLSYGGMMSFPKVFYGTVTQSLISFLIHNDRRRLKRCPVCEKFFIAKNANRDICSTKCQIFNTRDYFKRYMRKKRDKGGPDFDPNYI